jgi:glycosyltransferase involved in cell wall biosynthesis
MILKLNILYLTNLMGDAMKKIWILNHYASNMYYNEAGRHFWLAEHLIKKGYHPTIFCASTRHNTDQNVETGDQKFLINTKENIPFVFIKTPSYNGNGYLRIKNMFAFYRNLFSVSKKYIKLEGKPDLILASSVHPLTLVAGIKIAKKLDVPCICEVRDLWPESLVAYGAIKRESLIAKLLYRGEKWIYKKADAVVMTWAGGAQYIRDQQWDQEIDLSKVVHISNGVVLETFDQNVNSHVWDDPDLDDSNYQNVIYAGSIRKVNDLGMLLDAAKIIERTGNSKIRFLIYGDGDEREALISRCHREGISNVMFKGRVEKKYVPSILKRASINLLHNQSTSLDQYGQSQNKFFEYLAAGRCIVQTYTTRFSICEEYSCGVSASVQNAEEIARAIISISTDEARQREMGRRAREAAAQFDFGLLTDRLIDLIERLKLRGPA